MQVEAAQRYGTSQVLYTFRESHEVRYSRGSTAPRSRSTARAMHTTAARCASHRQDRGRLDPPPLPAALRLAPPQHPDHGEFEECGAMNMFFYMEQVGGCGGWGGEGGEGSRRAVIGKDVGHLRVSWRCLPELPGLCPAVLYG